MQASRLICSFSLCTLSFYLAHSGIPSLLKKDCTYICRNLLHVCTYTWLGPEMLQNGPGTYIYVCIYAQVMIDKVLSGI